MKKSNFLKFIAISLITVSAAMAGYAEKISEVNQKIVDAVAAGDLNEVVSHYTEDTTFLAPNAPILKGRDAVFAFYQGAIAQGAVALELETLELNKIGKRKVVEIGQNKIHFYNPATGETFIQTNKFMVIWKKTNDGWKVFYDAYNAI